MSLQIFRRADDAGGCPYVQVFHNEVAMCAALATNGMSNTWFGFDA